VRADQVRIVDPAVIQILAGLHLRLDLLDHVAFLDQVVRDLDAGDGRKRRGQHFRLVGVGRDRLGDNLDLHAGEGFRGIDEPLHLLFLVGARERRHVADLLVEERLGLVHSCECLVRPQNQCKQAG